MAYKISWTDNALEDYQRIVEYLIKKWSFTDAANFESIVNKKLANLSGQPFMGSHHKKNTP
jgi:plasmid stabilization system protein ParE